MDLQVFNFESKNVRTSVSTNGQPLFILKDVCAVLEISNSRDVSDRLDEDEKDVVTIDTLGGRQKINAVNESGLYSLVFASRKPEAKKFRKWVTSVVIPSISNTGSFSVSSSPAPMAIAPAAEVYASFDVVASKMGLEGNQKIISVNRATKKLTNVDFQNLFGMNFLINEAQERNLNPTQIGKNFNLGPSKINNILIVMNYQERVGRDYHALESGIPYRVLVDSGKLHSDGSPIHQLRWKESVIPKIKEYLNSNSSAA